MGFNPAIPSDTIKVRYIASACRQNFQAIYDKAGPDLNFGFPSGTRLPFYQSTAPIGWTIVSGISDCLLGVQGPSGSIYTTPGSIQGTWQLPDHTLTVNEMPKHTHGYYEVKFPAPGGFNYGVSYEQVQGGPIPGTETGNDQPHNHGMTWRPRAAIVIIAEKD